MPLQTLFDDLAGAAGHPVNRPALNAYITQGQSAAGLRTAETMGALQRAQQLSDQSVARDDLPTALSNLKDANGNTLLTPGQQQTITDLITSGAGNAETAPTGVIDMQKIGGNNVLGNPTQVGTPAATAASQVETGKVAAPVVVPGEYMVPAGMPAPTVQQTPLDVAKTAEQEALAKAQLANAGLHAAQTGQLGNSSVSPLIDNGLYVAARRYLQFGAQPSYAMFQGSGVSRGVLSNRFWNIVGSLQQNPHWLPSDGIPGTAPAAAPAAALAGATAPGAATAPHPGAPGVHARAPALGGAPAAAPTGAAVAAPSGPPINYAALPDAQRGYHAFMSAANGQAVRGYSTLEHSMPVFLTAIDALNNGNITPLNAVYQRVAQLTGSPVPTNMRLIPQYIGTEVMRALRGSGVFPEAEQKKIESAWSTAASMPQLLQAYQQTENLIGAGQAGLKTTYQGMTRGFGGQPGANIPSFEQILAGTEGGAPSTALPAGAAPGAAAAIQYAQNPKTGAYVEFRNGSWVPSAGPGAK
ncbi:MAG: hypothetical protein ACREU2_06750 [Steroidobacteraceae bacterium]